MEESDAVVEPIDRDLTELLKANRYVFYHCSLFFADSMSTDVFTSWIFPGSSRHLA